MGRFGTEVKQGRRPYLRDLTGSKMCYKDTGENRAHARGKLALAAVLNQHQMKVSLKQLGGLRGLLQIALSLIVAFISLAQVSAFAFFSGESHQDQTRHAVPDGTEDVFAITAIASEEGVLLQWQGMFNADNLGFNVYRLKDGQRARVNSEIVPGSVFVGSERAPMQGSYSYSWFDPAGSAASTYYIESVS